MSGTATSPLVSSRAEALTASWSSSATAVVDAVGGGRAWVVVVVALAESATGEARIGAAVVVVGAVVSSWTWVVDGSPDAAFAVVSDVGVEALAMGVSAVVLVVAGVENAALGVTLIVVRDVAATYERDAHS